MGLDSERPNGWFAIQLCFCQNYNRLLIGYLSGFYVRLRILHGHVLRDLDGPTLWFTMGHLLGTYWVFYAGVRILHGH
eukprot:12055252-Ditylum_brightwellii.AAC.1